MTGRGPRVARYETEALVLRVVPFAETSQVVHLATPEHGLVAALVKGARRPGPAFQGGLSLAAFGTAYLTTRRGAELELLRRFRRQDRFRGLGTDLERYFGACYVVELLRAWMRPALPNPALYRAGITTLAALAGASLEALPGWIALFEARAVDATGHRPRLDACAACGGVPGPHAVFSPAAGGLTHPTCAPAGPRRKVSALGLDALVRLYTVRIRDLVREPLAPAALKEVRIYHDLLIPHLLERRPAGLATIPRA